jgi:hypothetical protein
MSNQPDPRLLFWEDDVPGGLRHAKVEDGTYRIGGPPHALELRFHRRYGRTRLVGIYNNIYTAKLAAEDDYASRRNQK